MKNSIDRLLKFDNNKLIDVVKNYRQYGYDDELRNAAITLLKERGISKEDLQLTGNFTNRNYDRAGELYSAFGRNSAIAFCFYVSLIGSRIFLAIFLEDSESYTLFFAVLTLISLILFCVFLFKAFQNQSDFYKILGKEYDGALGYLLAGAPLYFLAYFYYRSQMAEQMKEIR